MSDKDQRVTELQADMRQLLQRTADAESRLAQTEMRLGTTEQRLLTIESVLGPVQQTVAELVRRIAPEAVAEATQAASQNGEVQ